MSGYLRPPDVWKTLRNVLEVVTVDRKEVVDGEDLFRIRLWFSPDDDLYFRFDPRSTTVHGILVDIELAPRDALLLRERLEVELAHHFKKK